MTDLNTAHIKTFLHKLVLLVIIPQFSVGNLCSVPLKQTVDGKLVLVYYMHRRCSDSFVLLNHWIRYLV